MRSRHALLSAAISIALTPAITACVLQHDRVVWLAVGSENVPFFQDSQVRDIFRSYGLDVQVTGFGSRQMSQMTNVDVRRYDAFVPSSQVTAEQLVIAHPSLAGQQRFELFQSPLAIATYKPIAACLSRLGIASQDSHGIWQFNVAAYLAAVQNVQHPGEIGRAHV